MNLFEELSSLPRHELDDARSERIRSAAHAVLAETRRSSESSASHRLSRMWHREIEPAFVVATSLSVLAWALSAIVALY